MMAPSAAASSSSNLRQRHGNKGTSTKTTFTTTRTTKVSRLDDNNNNDSSGGRITAKTEKQRSMLRQLHAHRQEEEERQHALNAAFSNLIQTYLKTLLVLCLAGFALLCFLAPTVVTQWSRAILNNPPLPPPARTLITIYPMHIAVRRDLPGFFQAHAIATPQNALARRAVQHAATLRKAISQQNNNNIYRQKMALVPWDVLDFTTQLRTMDSMDRFCSGGGTLGYGQAFYGLSSAAQDHQYQEDPDDISDVLFQQYEMDGKRHDLMLWCLLASGHHDGYITFHGVREIVAAVSRGTSGIAITKRSQRKDENENGHDNDKDVEIEHHQHDAIDSTSILFLPQHDSYKLTLGQPLGPSTLVPRKALAWIVEHVHLPLHSYRRGLEQFLYQVVVDEMQQQDAAEQLQAAAAAAALADSSLSSGSSSRSNATQPPPPPPPPPKWILWTASCTETERLAFEQQYRLIATSCTTTNTSNVPMSSNGNSTATVAQNSSSSSSKDSCCSFYDAKLPPLIRRRRRHDD